MTDVLREKERGDVRRRYEKAHKKDWWTNPVCHGETGFASWEYQLWLEDEVVRLTLKLQENKK